MSGTREMQKAATRARVLAASRKLFQERVFDEVGVRDIAAEAAVATGTVIATFGSKGDLMNAIIVEDCVAQLPAIQAAADGAHGVTAALKAIARVAVDHHIRQLPILRATLADGWLRSPEAEARVREAIAPTLRVGIEILRNAASLGQLRDGVNPVLLNQLLFEAMMGAFRHAVYDDVPHSGVWAIVEARFDLILAGLVFDAAGVAGRGAAAA